MSEQLSVMTRKGQITIPAEIRRRMGLQTGDKVAVILSPDKAKEAVLRPASSVAQRTFGAVTPHQRPEDFKALRQAFMEGQAEEVTNEGRTSPNGDN